MSLASEIKEKEHIQLIDTLIQHPKFQEILQAQIMQIKQENKALQLGAGIPLLIGEIYDSIQSMTTLKIKQCMSMEGCGCLQQGSKMSQQIDQIKQQIKQINRQRVEKTNNSFDKLLFQQRSILTDVLPCTSVQFYKVKQEIDQIKTSINDIIRQQCSSEKTIQVNPEIHSKMNAETANRSISRKRNHTSQLFAPTKLSNFRSQQFQKQFSFLLQQNDTIKQKLNKYQINFFNKYEDQFIGLTRALKKIQLDIGDLKLGATYNQQVKKQKERNNQRQRQKQKQKQKVKGQEKQKQKNKTKNDNNIQISRIVSEKSVTSLKSSRSNFSALLNWK